MVTSAIKNKFLITLICVIGIVAVFYGMFTDNDPVFIVGLLFVGGGYLLLRKKIKRPTANNF